MLKEISHLHEATKPARNSEAAWFFTLYPKIISWWMKGKTWSILEDGGPVAKNPPCNSGYVGLIPGQGTKIPPAWNN